MADQDHNVVVSADVEYMVRRGMTRGYQIFSLLTPPLYAAFVLARRGRNQLFVNRFLRATWLGGVAGSVGGGAVEWVRSSSASAESLRNRRMYHTYNTASIRADDHSTIGAILFAVLTPALFWNRARMVHLILGGSGIGSGVGLLAHYGRTIGGDPPARVKLSHP